MARDPYLSDPARGIDVFLKRVDDLLEADAGCKVSATFEQVRRGWAAIGSGTDAAAALRAITDAALSGDAQAVHDAIGVFTLASLAQPGGYRSQVARDVIRALREAYAETAPHNLTVISKRYDEAAGRLTAAAKGCDLATDADSMVMLPDKERAAWVAGAVAAGELDALLPVLVHAAELAGMMPAPVQIPSGSDAKPTDWTLALACDPAGGHRRKVWTAFESRGDRCGRWAGLVALGVTIRACPLDAFELYARPRPMEYRFTSVDIGGGVSGQHQELVDPEDRDYKPASPLDDPAAARESKAGKGDTAETEAPTADATT